MRRRFIKTNYGVTLVELMITIAVAMVISLVAFASYSLQTKTHGTQREIAKIQQDLRGAIFMIEYDLLNAGRDPFMSGQYGIRNVGYFGYNNVGNGYNLGALDAPMAPPANALPPFDSYPVIEFSALRWDADGDGLSDQNITIRYQVYDFNDDDRLDLCRRTSIPGAMNILPVAQQQPELVAEGVVAIGFAFAYDDNRDGTYKLRRTGALNNVIWAADTNGDNLLDTNLDANGDGEITAADDSNGDGFIDGGDLNTGLPTPPVGLEAVRAVRIMVLVQSERPNPENRKIRNERYAVGNRVITYPDNDMFQRRVETIIVAMRNFKKL
jgi:type IV pilus assembly protein PilW